jgi:RNA polymerase sigma-70 factor, ECF subfamily
MEMSMAAADNEANDKDVTALLLRFNKGDQAAQEDLLKVIYDELHARARLYMRRERPDHTLQATALVHEVYLRLIRQTDVEWQNRAQFYGVAAQMMRRVLVDYARNRYADKRGGEAVKISIDEAFDIADQREIDLITLDEVLQELSVLDERQSRIVEMRFFGGLSVEETAEVLGISTATVTREWRIAKMWLFNALKRTV